MKIFQRVLHGLAVVALALGAILTVVVVIASVYVTGFLAVGVGKPAEEVGISANLPFLTVVAGGVALAVLVLAICAIYWYVRWKWISLFGVLVVGSLGFLAFDSTPVPQADLGSRVGADDRGYQKIMWMSEASPFSRLSEAGVLDSNELTSLLLPAKGDDWPEFVRSNRELIIRAWNEDKLGREWIAAINATPPGGVWPQGLNAPFIAFKPTRAICNLRLAYACVLSVDGRSEEAVGVLVPVILAMHHLQRTGGNLVHEMIPALILKHCYACAGQIMKVESISFGSRALLGNALRAGLPIEQVIRNAYMGEQDFFRGCMDSIDGKYAERLGLKGDHVGLFDQILFRTRWVLINRNRTERLYVDALREVVAFVQARDLDGLKNWVPELMHSKGVRNPVGRLLIAMVFPAVQKIAGQLWAIEDLRLELLKQLDKP
ncbi:MAG: hypothetical protein QM715_12080 [Nibricoccus sp.]